MKYLKTYNENNETIPYIINIPINDKIFDIIKKHYNTTEPNEPLTFTLNAHNLDKFNINEIYILVYYHKKSNTNTYTWDTMQYFKRYYPDLDYITIEDWLKKHYPDLTVDEIIQSNKLGLL